MSASTQITIAQVNLGAMSPERLDRVRWWAELYLRRSNGTANPSMFHAYGAPLLEVLGVTYRREFSEDGVLDALARQVIDALDATVVRLSEAAKASGDPGGVAAAWILAGGGLSEADKKAHAAASHVRTRR